MGSSIELRSTNDAKSGENCMTGSLEESDPEVFQFIRNEKERQRSELELIASENFTSAAVLQALSSCYHNKYSRGNPGLRYYGADSTDGLQKLCQKRALAVFKLNPEQWGVNVQPYSGSPANLAVYTAIVGQHGRIMGLDTTDGGHFTHGFKIENKALSSASIFFETMSYKVKQETGLIDYEQLQKNAQLFKPKVIIAGTSCYPRLIDYKRMKQIADQNKCYLMADMAHISGMVAAGVIPSPFEHCDVVTSTTHKSLRGPRAGIIFYRKGVRYHGTAGKPDEMYNIERPINEAVFPGLQGGPHNHTIAGVAVALHQANLPFFVEYQNKVLANAKTLARVLLSKGYELVTGGTDTHLVLINLKNKKIDGYRVDKVLEAIGVSCNKYTCPGDDWKGTRSGLRVGSPALTSRELEEADFEKVCDFIDRGVQLALEIQSSLESNAVFKEFQEKLCKDPTVLAKVRLIKDEVKAFAQRFPIPGLKNL